MQGRPGRRPRARLRDTSLDLSQEDRLRLVDALRGATTLDAAARKYGLTDHAEFRRLAIREGFGPLIRPLIFPLRHISAAHYRTFMRWIQQGRSATKIAKSLGVKRQAVEQRIQRLGLWAAYKDARVRAKQRHQGMWQMLSSGRFRRLLPIADALAARGSSVGCVPVYDTDCKRVVDCRLIADATPVRILRPAALWRKKWYRADLRDLSCHYVVVTPTGDCLWYPVPHGPGPVYIPIGAGGAAAVGNGSCPPTATWSAGDYSDPWAEESVADPLSPGADEEDASAVSS